MTFHHDSFIKQIGRLVQDATNLLFLNKISNETNGLREAYRRQTNLGIISVKCKFFTVFLVFNTLFFPFPPVLLKRLRWKNNIIIWLFPHLFVTLQPKEMNY